MDLSKEQIEVFRLEKKKENKTIQMLPLIGLKERIFPEASRAGFLGFLMRLSWDEVTCVFRNFLSTSKLY